MLKRPLAPLLRSTAPRAALSSLPPHPPLLPSRLPLRAFSTSSAAANSYRRFGDPPRRSGPPPPSANEANDPLRIILSRLPQKEVSPRSSDGRGSGYGHSSGYGARHGFTLHNLRAYLQSPIFVVLVAGAGTYYVLHLERTPETGRWRFIDVSREMERTMGRQTYQEVLAEYRGKVLPDWAPEARYVQAVVKRIVRANGLEEKLAGGDGFRTHVIKEDGTKNAFVLPTGDIFVFTGILSVAQDADGLAVVLGHEIAHQVLRHSAERMSGMKVFYGLALLLSTFGIDFGISQIFLQLVMSLPNSRKNESEADLVGLRLSNAACYDPRAAEGLWQRMGAAEQAQGVDMSFLSTHPSSKNRTVKVREWAEEVIKDRPEQCGPLKGQVAPFQQFSGARW
ncbi:hypothetical protein JCM10207_004372 [Rhodosporidiobolus poonsookiae]